MSGYILVNMHKVSYSETRIGGMLLIGILTISMVIGPMAFSAIPKAEAQKSVLKMYAPISSAGGGTFFSPFLTPSQRHMQVLTAMYETLVELNPDGTVKPWLAEKWTASADGLTYTFSLDKRAKWSDGKPVTAEDVAFSYITYDKLGLFMIPGILLSAQAADSSTVTMKLKRSVASFLPLVVAAMMIVPKSAWQNVTDFNKMPLPIALKTNPELIVGSGPFILKEWSEGQYGIFSKNPNYWKAPVYIDELQVIEYTVLEARTLALTKGDLDLDVWLDPTQMPGLTSYPVVKLNTTAALYGFGTRWGYNFRMYPLNVKEVRQAIDLSISRQAVVDKGWMGYALMGSNGMIPSAYTRWYNPAAAWPGLKYSTDDARYAAANAMLDKLGFTKGTDGIRVTPNGTRLEFQLLTSSSGTLLRIAELGAADLAKIGVKATIKSSATVHSDVWTAGREGAPKPAWGFYTMPHSTGLLDPDFLLLALFSNPPYIGTNGIVAAQAGPYNSTLNDLLLAASQEMDYQKRKDLVFKIQMIAADLVPISMLAFGTAGIIGYRTDKFTGFTCNYAGSAGNQGNNAIGPQVREALLQIRPIGVTTTTPPTTTTTTTAPPVTVTASVTATATTTVSAPAEGVSLWGWVAVVVAVIVCIPLGYVAGRRKPAT